MEKSLEGLTSSAGLPPLVLIHVSLEERLNVNSVVVVPWLLRNSWSPDRLSLCYEDALVVAT